MDDREDALAHRPRIRHMMHRQIAATAAALTALLSSAPLTAGNGRWTAIGPEGGPSSPSPPTPTSPAPSTPER